MLFRSGFHEVLMAKPAENADSEETDPKTPPPMDNTNGEAEEDPAFPAVRELTEDEVAKKPPSSKKKKKSAKKLYAKAQKKKSDRLAESANQNLEPGGGSGSKASEKKKEKQREEVPAPQMSELEEADLIQTPVGKHEPPEVLEARRQPLMREQQQLFRSRENLMQAQAAVKAQQEEIEEYERRNRSDIKTTRLPGIGVPEDQPVRRRLENPSWQR